MKKPICKARVIPVSAETVQGYRWQWRSDDGEQVSPRAFELFHDCLADARARGFEVELPSPPAG